VTYHDQIDLGYGTFNDKNRKGNLDFDLSYIGTVELGMKWSLSQRLSLYTGIYADYTFNNVMKDKGNDAFVVYNEHEPWNFRTNSILTSELIHQQNTERFTDKLQPMAVGLKLKLGVNLCKIEKKKRKKASLTDLEEIEQLIISTVRKEAKGMMQEIRDLANELFNEEEDTPSKESAGKRRNRSRKKQEEPPTPQAQTQEKDRVPTPTVIYRADMENYNLTITGLSVQQRSFLHEFVEIMRENPNVRLEITGHTCNLGSDELNMRVGQERADWAKDYLVQNGIRPSRITTFSRGKTEPVYPNNNETNRRKNRRLEFRILKD
jgi:outer membrane protein OmpA-like peptidoglycan-associated protein